MSLRIQKRNIITYGAMGGSGIPPKNCVETLFFKLFQGFPWETPLEAIFNTIFGTYSRAPHSSAGDDISFLNAQRHLLKGLSINFFIWYRANMDLKKFFDDHVQTPSEALLEGNP